MIWAAAEVGSASRSSAAIALSVRPTKVARNRRSSARGSSWLASTISRRASSRSPSSSTMVPAAQLSTRAATVGSIAFNRSGVSASVRTQARVSLRRPSLHALRRLASSSAKVRESSAAKASSFLARSAGARKAKRAISSAALVPKALRFRDDDSEFGLLFFEVPLAHGAQ